MPAIRAIGRRALIAYLRQLGFEDPFPSKRHQFMQKDSEGSAS
jgi:hypothetical protein